MVHPAGDFRVLLDGWDPEPEQNGHRDISWSLTPAFCVFYCYMVTGGGLTGGGDYPSRSQSSVLPGGRGDVTWRGSVKGTVIAIRPIMEHSVSEAISEHVKGKQGFPEGKLCWTPRVATNGSNAGGWPVMIGAPGGLTQGLPSETGALMQDEPSAKPQVTLGNSG